MSDIKQSKEGLKLMASNTTPEPRTLEEAERIVERNARAVSKKLREQEERYLNENPGLRKDFAGIEIDQEQFVQEAKKIALRAISRRGGIKPNSPKPE